MSGVRRGLNAYLRWTEKRRLTRATDIDALRRSFAWRAGLFFHGPWGTRYAWDSLGDVPVQWAGSGSLPAPHGPVLLYFHGGGYVFGSTNTHRAMLARLSNLCGVPACLVEYRLAPEHPFPAALDDAIAAYRHVATRPVIIGGDSAGGGLAFALLADVLRRELQPPLGIFGFSPFTDLTFSGASVTENAARDVMLPATRISEISQAYLDGAPADDPRASPVFADFSGAPDAWICAGSTEILRDDSVRLVENMRQQGVDVTFHLERDLPHVWPIFHNVLPEARRTLDDLATWIKARVYQNTRDQGADGLRR